MWWFQNSQHFIRLDLYRNGEISRLEYLKRLGFRFRARTDVWNVDYFEITTLIRVPCLYEKLWCLVMMHWCFVMTLRNVKIEGYGVYNCSLKWQWNDSHPLVVWRLSKGSSDHFNLCSVFIRETLMSCNFYQIQIPCVLKWKLIFRCNFYCIK
jgi:hypothetical protein